MKFRSERQNRKKTLAHTLFLLGCAIGSQAIAQSRVNSLSETWRLDHVDAIHGHPTTIFGHPQVISTPFGKAVHFNGVDDALFVGVHPLAGASTWTWETIIKPDFGGPQAQRFFNLSVLGPDGKDTDDRMLSEIRVVGDEWYLDNLAATGPNLRALFDPKKRYPLGKWYRVAVVYDGKTLSNYVGEELQNKGDVDLAPQGAGHASIGVRINKQFFFKGTIYASRFTRKALPVEDFMKLPTPQ